MSAGYIQKNLDELRKRINGEIIIVDDIINLDDIIDLDDEYMYEQLETAEDDEFE